MKINKIVELQRDNRRYAERVNKLLEKDAYSSTRDYPRILS